MSRKRRRKAKKTARKPRVEKVLPGPVKPGLMVRVACVECEMPTPVAHGLTTGAGYCADCACYVSIEEDHPGGIRAYQKKEQYRPLRIAYDEWLPGGIATRKPNVGGECGPPHFLDATPVRLCDILGEKQEIPPDMTSGVPMGAPKSMRVSLRKEFARVEITRTARTHMTPKEQEAVDMFLAGMGVREIGRSIGIRHPSVRRRLKAALAKAKGTHSPVVIMANDEIEALERDGRVMATL